MKIGLVCPYNLFKGGGVQECVLAMRAELTSRGHEVLIITFRPSSFKGRVPPHVRMLGRGRDVKSPFSTTAQISVTVDIEQVDELFENEQFDVLHFHEPWVPLLSLQLLTRSRAKNIATFHAKLPDTVMSRTIEKVITPYTKSLLKYFSAMTAVSEPAASYVRSLTSAKVQIVPNGIDLQKYKKTNEAAASGQTIFYIGRLEKRKGVKFLLKAVKELQKTNLKVSLVIAGDGPDRASLERYAQEHVIPVSFMGKISEAEKLKQLHSARVFCSPAHYGESFGIVLLEAMACGLPVVAGDNPGYASVLTSVGSMSLVDPLNTLQFASKLHSLMNDETKRKAWQEWAQQNIGQYDYRQVVDKYLELYAKT